MRRREFLRALGGIGIAGAAGSVPVRAGREERTPTPTPRDPEDSAEFAPLAFLAIAEAREAVVGGDGTTVYLALDDGFAIVDVSAPEAPRLLVERRGLLADEGGPVADIQDVSIEEDRLLVVGPAHRGTDGPKAAIVYDVSDPADPDRVGVHRTDYPIHNGYLASGRAYLTANDDEANPLEIVELDDEPRVVGRWAPADADAGWTDVPATVRPIHDVIVHDDVAYCSYWDAGTWLVDVSDPGSPRALGRVGQRSPASLAAVDDPGREVDELPGNHHSAAIDESGTLLAVGREAWDADGDGAGGPGGIDLVDVAAADAPTMLSRVEPPPTPDPTIQGVWTTAHNFELRDDRLYSAWYQGGIRVHDVSDPHDPREIAAWRDAATTRFWTAQRTTDAIVASSMDAPEGGAGLYTFPLPRDGPTSTGAGAAEPTTGPPQASSAEGDAPTDRSPIPRSAVSVGVGAGTATVAVGGWLAWFLSRRRSD